MPADPTPFRYITPEPLMRIRFGDGPRPRWEVGILCFRGETGCEALARRLGSRPVAGKTFYRETADDVRRWRALGARAVNMETTPLYAAAAACGVRSLRSAT